MKPIKTVVIVGGGTAGWMTAAAMAALAPGYDLILVESDEIGTVGVGEATIPPIMRYNRGLGIDEAQFVRETQATFKLGIEFVGWSKEGERYLHPFGVYGVEMESIHFHQHWLRYQAAGGRDHVDLFNSSIQAAYAGKFEPPRVDDRSPLPAIAYAYHFDASLYAAFLRRRAEAGGVRRIEGKIARAALHPEHGVIEAVELQDGRRVEGDFFVDCSGFRGLLISEALGAGYDDWRGLLPCDRAVAVPCDRLETTLPFTRATAREAGWQWRIPLQHRIGNGYVFCSAFLSEDQAADLVLSRLDGAARAQPRLLKFVPGLRHAAWRKNCVAIGLASGFLEPLESTSIHLIQTGIARLLGLFPRMQLEPATEATYNMLTRREFEDIRDFLILHYRANERPEPFWRMVAAMPMPDSLKARMDLYRSTAKLVFNPGELFNETSWFAVMHGQGVRAETLHPFVDSVPMDELHSRLARIRAAVDERVSAMPSHDAYIARNCAATPIKEVA